MWYRIRSPFRWIRFWSGWIRCPIGWHQDKVWYITDGSTSVWCLFCRKKREPTAEELANHSDVDFTPGQRAAQNASVEAIHQWLEENGHI